MFFKFFFFLIHRQILDIYQRVRHSPNASIGNEHEAAELSRVGIAFFYDVVNGINEYMNIYPPSHELLSDVLSQLGALIREHQATEGIRLLKTALTRPHLVQMLSEIFTPSTTAPVHFLEMYQFVVQSHMLKCDTKILFVLLSKVRC